MLCSCFFSYSYSASRYSYSYSNRSSIAIRPIGPQVPANRLDQRSASPQFKQPSSTSTVALSTVRRGGLSTSTTKSNAKHERMLCSCKLRLRRDEPDGRLTQRPSSSSWPPSASCRRGLDLQLQRPCCGSVFFRCRRAAEEMNGLGQIARTPTITEWPPKKSLKLSAADRPLRCMVMFWLFFVLVLSEAVLVLDRSSNCIIPSWSTR
jgi:hypothetical protein